MSYAHGSFILIQRTNPNSYSNDVGAKALLLARGAGREEFREQSANCEQDGVDGIGLSPFCFVCIACASRMGMLLTK